MATLDEATMHAAVEQRDASYDQEFVYGVVTTGVCCRPSCRSRRALRENRRYFSDVAQALIAGFRPCKKCSPVGFSPNQQKLIDSARFIEENAARKLTLKSLAARVDLSEAQLRRAFQASFGMTPKAMIDGVRRRLYRSALTSGKSVTQAIYAAGYSSVSQVYGQKSRGIGMHPKTYSRGASGEEILYIIGRTDLGYLLMAATKRGVCCAEFADTKAELHTRFASEFPAAERLAASKQKSPALASWMDAFVEHIQGQAPRPDLPLDLRGSLFQIQVWNYLMQLQEGDVVSYSDVAHGIDKPKAVRAAASACGANKVAVLVPCHRVLRSDGSLGGYRWGESRKKALLKLEEAR